VDKPAPVAWIVTKSYEYAGLEILRAFASEASALAFAAKHRADSRLDWGEARVHDGSTFWSDGYSGTLAVERHELAP